MYPSFLVYAIRLLLCWPFSSVLAYASDNRLVPGKPLSPGSVLVSQDGVFALGFFSPSNSTYKQNHHYVGIWYNGIPERTVVWVSNRAAPITTNLSYANLAVTSTSNIALSDSNGRVLWITNNGISIDAMVSVEAVLDNTGNFILRSLADTDSAILWQSFDHPTDTLLPGMNLRLSHKTLPLQHLVSWKGQQDPSPGDFSYGADPSSLLQCFVWNGSTPHRRSPVSVWTNYLYMDRLDESSIYMALHHAGDEVYMSFGMPTGSLVMLVRMEIHYSGKLNILSWESNMSVWRTRYAEPQHECNMYGYCGPYGYCDTIEIVPVCKCLDGFEPRDGKGWSSGRFSQGCRRKEVLRCTHGDGFLAFSGMKVPDKFLHVPKRSFAECTEECRSNCSCVAYAYSMMSNIDIDGDDTRCLVWMGGLIDMDMENHTQGGENLYVRTRRLQGNMRKMKTLEIALILLAVVSSFLILICVGLIWIYGFRDDTRKSLLNWPTRFKIIKGVARGLLYLHQDSRLMMIHRDLKASNILLDAEMGPKISDFGTARIFGVHEQERHTNRVVGTFGYMSPEYAMEGVISVKSDVYSFGVLLLEIVSGIKTGTTTTSACARAHNLIDYAWSLRKDGKMMDLIESSIIQGCCLVEALRCIHIGLLSVQDDPDARPLMSWVVASLDNQDIDLPQPKEPMCFSRRNYGGGESHIHDMSLENLKGR
ncbi:G-type lectin S-receptor-like serine/threonine-protein kinase B120 [Hordeum vulgare subsp. vulgare]|uniref:G-type lectin S-receptor-like serine/threonine-protein kinase B120 n=1 Tax=Hordeum vulgare subsp. vulgare TaxID=112509 RepID=UPI001D1A51DD|nr:G-type lectin S-receptor-like serine/threonine-protein kinase B120 [Hordeum vulgare subsp. vulgare]